MSWFSDYFCPDVSDLHRDIAALRLIADAQTVTLHKIRKELLIMAAREDAAYEALTATILTVKDGWASLVAERDALKEALENADANAAAQVAAALEADSDVDAAKVEAADAALAELVVPAEPTPDEPA